MTFEPLLKVCARVYQAAEATLLQLVLYYKVQADDKDIKVKRQMWLIGAEYAGEPAGSSERSGRRVGRAGG